MNESLKALLRHVVDYAGLFPPALLDFDAAVRDYARHRAGPHAWMLGRFICPSARLPDLETYLEPLFAEGRALPVSVLCRAPAQPATAAMTLDEDVRAARALLDRHGPRVSIELFELKIPACLTHVEEVRQLLSAAATVFHTHGFARVPAFWEPLNGDDWRETHSAVVGGIDAVNAARKAADGGAAFGFKIRCGGVEPSAFPPVEQLACGIVSAARAGVPLKFTAGLHHPLRHDNKAAGCTVHGFVNVFTAAILAGTCGIDESAASEVLAARDAGAFRFRDDGLRWGDLHATVDQIASARRSVATAFGSCSFDEPRDDLLALGWLP
ncbi:MAG: hypothetical protein C4547_15295 [Phycisphaerales bacterium]|nr:MAG: hypothetical protein C4547_15295 [Phycisphaerales bacterium]